MCVCACMCVCVCGGGGGGGGGGVVSKPLAKSKDHLRIFEAETNFKV